MSDPGSILALRSTVEAFHRALHPVRERCNDGLDRTLDRARNSLLELLSERREHMVGDVDTRGRTTDAEAEPSEVLSVELRRDALHAAVTTAPALVATSHMREPKTPATPTTISSPGSSRFTRQASMPALPVADRGSVMAFVVPNRIRRLSWTSSRTARKAGSRCPTRGCDMAARTASGTLEGPGPRSRRGGNRTRAGFSELIAAQLSGSARHLKR